MRVDYTGPAADLTEQACAAGWRPVFESWLAAAIERGVSEPNAMVLATISADGLPATRTVLCKGMSDTGIAFYTNYESGKARGHFVATGIRPTFMDRLESAGVRLPSSAFRERVMLKD